MGFKMLWMLWKVPLSLSHNVEAAGPLPHNKKHMQLRYDPKLIDLATSRWLSNHPSFNADSLRKDFLWTRPALVEEDIAFWLSHGLAYLGEDGLYHPTGKNLPEPLLFLDVDGVLNHADCHDLIDPECVKRLGEIVRLSKARVLLISSWGHGWHDVDKARQDDKANFLDATLAKEGIVIERKISAYLGNRTFGIADLILKYDATRWVILDDEVAQYVDPPLSSRLVATSYLDGGLTEAKAKEALTLLTKR